MKFPDAWWQKRIDRDGDFEPESRTLALRHVRNWGAAIDGGAHCGVWTGAISSLFGEVHAFEPCLTNYRCLAENIKAPNARLYQLGLGDRPGSFGMARGPESDPNQNSGQMHMTAGDEVSVLPLDALNIRNVGLIKLDVEGFELFALKGAEQTIRRDMPVIVFEENGLSKRYGVKDGDAGKVLESWGYKKEGQCRKDHIYIAR